MPRRRRSTRRKRNLEDIVHFPLAYSFNAGSGGETNVGTIGEAFDRTRPFRIGALWGELSSIKYPTLVQFQAFSPVNASDNTWTSPQILVPTGTVRRFRYRIPATNGWYPSDTATTTKLLILYGDCIDKSFVGHVVGNAYLEIHLRPRDIVAPCSVSVMSPLSPWLHPRSGDSPSVSQIPEESSSDEYFSS